MATITAPDILDMAWDTATAGDTVNFKVTTDDTVFAHAMMRIRTNGAAIMEPVGAIALRNWSHTLEANQTIIGVISMVFESTGAATARIVSECRRPDGSIVQNSYDSTYNRTGHAGESVGVSVT